ncbi:hypothetical protein Y032_0070g412 [Ancylostoma ceylanicum]|uniref:Uncharacterized protein n=1 Tax=Ancylostoma ceylanicum TaxID=53326 RepID=A0A016TX63_9BILA|nr:hypothetical protein Y032_0070g412 [Ancylostoma ceylanicum]
MICERGSTEGGSDQLAELLLATSPQGAANGRSTPSNHNIEAQRCSGSPTLQTAEKAKWQDRNGNAQTKTE